MAQIHTAEMLKIRRDKLAANGKENWGVRKKIERQIRRLENGGK